MLAKRGGGCFIEIGGVAPVGVDQAAKQESNQQADLESANCFGPVILTDSCDDIADAADQHWVLEMLPKPVQ